MTIVSRHQWERKAESVDDVLCIFVRPAVKRTNAS